jgi:hypothetical protein
MPRIDYHHQLQILKLTAFPVNTNKIHHHLTLPPYPLHSINAEINFVPQANPLEKPLLITKTHHLITEIVAVAHRDVLKSNRRVEVIDKGAVEKKAGGEDIVGGMS